MADVLVTTPSDEVGERRSKGAQRESNRSTEAEVLAVLQEIVNGQEKELMDHAFEHNDEREEERQHELIRESISRSNSSRALRELGKEAPTSLLPRLAHASSDEDDYSVDYEQENDVVVLNENIIVSVSSRQRALKGKVWPTAKSPAVEKKTSDDTEEEDNNLDDPFDAADNDELDRCVIIPEIDTVKSLEEIITGGEASGHPVSDQPSVEASTAKYSLDDSEDTDATNQMAEKASDVSSKMLDYSAEIIKNYIPEARAANCDDSTEQPNKRNGENITECKSDEDFDIKVIDDDEPLTKAASLVSRRTASLIELLEKDTSRQKTGHGNEDTSTNVKAMSKRYSYGCGRDNSFGNRYKKGMITGLSLETKPDSRSNTHHCKTRATMHSTDRQLPEVRVKATRKSPRHSHNSRSVLKKYNKELFYSNEFSYLLDLDPAERSTTGGVAMDKVRVMVAECPSVCRQKFDLTLDGEVKHVYPLFSLVAHQAPLDIVKKVFEQNPFSLMDERDDQGQTLLHYACAFNPPSQETLNFIIHQTSKCLETFDNQQRSPLHTACARLAEATDTVLFILKESPQKTLVTPDKQGFLPMSLALTNAKCSLELVKSLLERNPDSVAFKTAEGDLPVALAEKNGLSKDIIKLLLEKTPSHNITQEHLGLVLKNSTQSSSLQLVVRLVEEDIGALARGGSDLPIRVAHNHNASKAIMKYLFEHTPKDKIPEWMAKLKPTDDDVKRAIEAEMHEETARQMKADKAVDVKPHPVAPAKAADVVSPTPSFWERLCCRPLV